MSPLIESNLGALAALLFLIGVVAGVTGAINKAIEWNEQRIRRKRARCYPNRWPRNDHRVGQVYRRHDIH